MIYNFKEIKKILSVSTNFIGNSDTEVLAKVLNYGVLNTNTLDYVSFCWFAKKKRNYLVRDPMGEKPLIGQREEIKFIFHQK